MESEQCNLGSFFALPVLIGCQKGHWSMKYLPLTWKAFITEQWVYENIG